MNDHLFWATVFYMQKLWSLIAGSTAQRVGPIEPYNWTNIQSSYYLTSDVLRMYHIKSLITLTINCA